MTLRAHLDPLRICVIASSRFPIREPFAGGLEAHTHGLVNALRARGHEVALFAGPGSDPALRAELLDVTELDVSESARQDLAAPPRLWMREHHAYLALMLALRDRHDIDVVHNNSLHHLPVAMAPSIAAPMVTTLHTPPLPWLESAVALAPRTSSFVAVSHSTRRQWRHVVAATVVHNGVDPDFWTEGPGGAGAVWSGRIVPEKAPHLAIDAAAWAGVALELYGPVGDPAYFRDQVVPRLGPSVRYGGHVDRAELREHLRRAGVALVTPQWDEPFGLVAAEAQATGTPVAAFDRGAMHELISDATGRLSAPDDIAGLGAALLAARTLPRAEVRRSAVARFGLSTMVDRYESVYRRLLAERAA